MLSHPTSDMNFVRRRRVNPELLDQLPIDDPRATGSRHDLRRINAIMMQPRIVARALARHCKSAPRTIIDLGSGDGTFMLKVARRFSSRWRDVTVTLLDRQNLVSRETRDRFTDLRWRAEPLAADVFDFLELLPLSDIDAVIANLFLHHFEDRQLKRLLKQVARQAPLFVACEPRRGGMSVLLSAMTWAIGANEVTRHDAVASVRAGFRGQELSALWPEPDRWRLHESAATPFSHCFVAVRNASENDHDL
jgi:methyltransferase family protein